MTVIILAELPRRSRAGGRGRGNWQRSLGSAPVSSQSWVSQSPVSVRRARRRCAVGEGELTWSAVVSGLFGKKEMRILMVGLDAAGKTTILYVSVGTRCAVRRRALTEPDSNHTRNSNWERLSPRFPPSVSPLSPPHPCARSVNVGAILAKRDLVIATHFFCSPRPHSRTTPLPPSPSRNATRVDAIFAPHEATITASP